MSCNKALMPSMQRLCSAQWFPRCAQWLLRSELLKPGCAAGLYLLPHVLHLVALSVLELVVRLPHAVALLLVPLGHQLPFVLALVIECCALQALRGISEDVGLRLVRAWCSKTASSFDGMPGVKA